MLAIFLETLNITAPVFAMLFLGVLLKRINWINDNFIHTASSLVFNVTMPALLFLGILHADLQQKFGIAQPRILVCGLNPHTGEGGHLGQPAADCAAVRTKGVLDNVRIYIA